MFENRIDLSGLQESVGQIRAEIGKVIVGQTDMVDLLIAALLADGHVLIEGVPGVAKTLTAKLLARTLSIGFARIQFTPDLMPSDVIGTNIYHINSSKFEFKKGPIFSNIVLIDEINRAPAKTQSALFEVMEERQITNDGVTYPMPPPFLVVATQNPIEQEGTYRLPEAQLDRFLFKITVDYPAFEQEIGILELANQRKNKLDSTDIQAVMGAENIAQFRDLVHQVQVDRSLLEYIARITENTRKNSFLYLGASPRASLSILVAAKAMAAMEGRDFVTPDDIKRVTFPVLGHRIILTPETEMEGITTQQVVEQIIQKIEIPR